MVETSVRRSKEKWWSLSCYLSLQRLVMASAGWALFPVPSWFYCSVTQSCPTLQPYGLQYPRLPCPSLSPRVCSNSCPWVSDAIQPPHPQSPFSPPACNLSHHQGLFWWVSSSHQVAKVLEFQFQHQSFQWIFRTEDPMNSMKRCTQYASKIGKLSSGHRTGKGQFSFQFQRKAMPKNAQTTTQLHSFTC